MFLVCERNGKLAEKKLFLQTKPPKKIDPTAKENEKKYENGNSRKRFGKMEFKKMEFKENSNLENLVVNMIIIF